MTAPQKAAPDHDTSAGPGVSGDNTHGKPDTAHGTRPFGDFWEVYVDRGWDVIPLPAGAKFPPPPGFTGYDGKTPTINDYIAWGEDGDRNIAVRIHETCVGIDVDGYDGKAGTATLRDLIEKHGELPKTWMSTSRTDGSGIRFFRIPAGTKLVQGLPGIEFCQYFHRYAVVAPSVHPKTGARYVWIDETSGEVDDTPPDFEGLPFLPSKWIEALRGDLSHGEKTSVSRDEVREAIQAFPAGDPCRHILNAAGKAMTGGSRHDTYNHAVLGVCGAARRGCPGGTQVLARLREAFLAEVATDRPGGRREAEDEWNRGLEGAVSIVVKDPQLDECSDQIPWGWEIRTPEITTANDNQSTEPVDHPEGAQGQPRFVKGGSFIIDASPVPEAIWGDGSEVLWSLNEALIITGGIGAGKTTLLGRLLRASIGLEGEVCGYPVKEAPRCLYLAADRPKQIARNLRRMFQPEDRSMLDERVTVLPGPAPADIVTQPNIILETALAAGLESGDRIFLDSAKDWALDLADNKVGSAWNMATQMVIAAEIDIVANHHQRKAVAGKNAAKPKTLSDVYGSTWITAGAGTVLLLWPTEPGSPYVEMSLLKTAAEDIGVKTLLHDIDAGAFTIEEKIDPLAILVQNRHTTMTVTELARACGWGEDRSAIERMRRRLQREVQVETVRVFQLESVGGGRPTQHYQWVGKVL